MIALLRTYLAPYKRALALVVGLLVVQALATLYLPALNGDDHQQRRRQGRHDLHPPDRHADARRSRRSWSSPRSSPSTSGSKTGMSFGRDVRGCDLPQGRELLARRARHVRHPSLITRNTNDVQQVQMVVLLGLNMMIIAPILAVGGIILALRQDVPLSGILIVVLPIMAIIVGTLMYRALPLFQAMQVKVDRVNQVTREALSGIRVIRAFVRTRHEEERFDVANKRPDRDLPEGQPDVRDHDPAAHGGLQPVERRDPVVRRDPGRQRRDADRQPHRVPAVRHADPVRGDDGRVHVHHGPAGRRLLRPDPGGPPDRALDRRPRGPRDAAAGPRDARLPRRRVPLPGRPGPGPARHLAGGRAGHDDGHRRQHRQRQDHAHQPHPALLRRDRRPARHRRHGRADDPTATTCGPGSGSSRRRPSCSAARSPATSATARPTRPTTSCGRPCASPRPRASSASSTAASRRP